MIDATTPTTIVTPWVAATVAGEGLPSAVTSARDTTVKEMQPTRPDLCETLASTLAYNTWKILPDVCFVYTYIA